MIDNIIRFFLEQRLISLSLALLIAALGIWSALKLPVDSFPDVSNMQVQVITEPEAMATEEIESQVTVPIESVLNGLPGIKLIRSTSTFGLSVVTAIFDDNMDIYFCRQLVEQRLRQLKLPEGSPEPQLGPVVSTFSDVYNYYLQGDQHSMIDLRTIQDWQVARRLRSVPGVANVVTYGGFVKQYQVFIKPDALKAYDLTVDQVSRALAANNVNAGGNFIVEADEEVIIRSLGRISSPEEIGEIVIKSVDGTPVFVRQVAQVKVGPAFRRGSASMNGQGEAVTGMVLTRKGVNTKAVVEQVRKKLEEIAHELPPGVSIHPYYDQTELVDKTIETVKEILLLSGGLVVIVLTAVLLHIPSAFIVFTVIPLSLLVDFIAMKATGLSANLVTLGAVDFGIVVDSGVVMVENIYRQLSRLPAGRHDSQTVMQVVCQAACEVGRPIVFAISIITAVYLPLFTLEGVEGRMFHPLALTFIYALAGALIASLTFVPVLCFWFMRGPLEEKHNPVLEAIKNAYTPLLQRATQRPVITLVAAVAALVSSILLVPLLGSEFIPSLDEGSILVRTKLAPSVSHQESMRVAAVIEKILKSYPEVTVVVSHIGRSGMGSDLEGIDNSDVYVGLKPRSEWTSASTKDELVSKMAAQLEHVPGLAFSFSQPIADMIDDLVAGINADLGVKVFGDDLEKTDAVARQILSLLADIPGAADLQKEHILGLPQLKIKLKREELARHGLNVEDVQDLIQTTLAGKVVTEVLEDSKRFGLLVRYQEKYRDTVSAIETLMVDTPSGARIPLKQLAEIGREKGTVMINREGQERRTAVLANVRGRDLGSFVEEAQRRVGESVTLPRGYYIVWGGQFENQQRAMSRLAIVVPIVLLIIFVLLFTSFNSLKNAGLIMLVVPFSLIGGIVGLFVTRQPLSVPAIIGFIALFGVSVQNGIILVTYIMQLQNRGRELHVSAIEGAQTRLRPVLMTAMVAVVGLLPKIFSTGTGAEIQRPLATVMLGGLVSATVLTLFVLPALYIFINKQNNQREMRSVESSQQGGST